MGITEKNIVVFTNTYPYLKEGNAEAVALNAFVPLLARVFKRVILVPIYNGKYQGNLGEGVELSEDLKLLIKSKFIRMFYGASAAKVYKEFLSYTKKGMTFQLLRELIVYWGISKIVERWCRKALPRLNLNNENTILYSFWFHASALGASMFGKTEQYIVCSSAHGYDLYEFLQLYSKLPFRYYAMKLIDEVYPVSFFGAEYLKEKYPEYQKKIRAFRTGTLEPGFVCMQSTDGVFRVLSISRLESIKRINMILDAILLFASHVPSLNIEWVHIGGGNELSYYQSIAKLKSLPNAEIKFLGDLSGINLIQYIKSRPVDVFVNSSSSEGLSLALMEALSMGIPLIATRVGGNIELMSNENGILLPQSASAVDLADAFQYFIENPKEIEQWRINSRLCWEKHFNATKNFSLLSQYLYDTVGKIK